MKKYCFMMTGNEVWLNAAIDLYDQGIAKPVFWLGDDRHYLKAKEVFGDNVFSMNDFVHYQQNIQDIDYSGENFDFFLSDNYLRAKDRCLKMMDRLDLYGSFSRQDREVIFNKLAIFILKKLKESRPDALIMAEHAHSHAQYLVLEICIYLDIEIAKFNTWMLGPLLYMQNIKTGKRLIVDFKINDDLNIQLENDIKCYVAQVLKQREKSNFELDYMKRQRLNIAWKSTFLRFIRSGWYELAKETWFQFRKIINNNYYSINPYKLGFLMRLKIKKLRKRNLIKEHDKWKDDIQLKGKYVYFGLHFEPERTTNPDGGSFHDQVLAIIALRQLLPEDIEIVVKEHPSQFYIFDRGSRGRSPLFYDLIKNIHGVKLAGYLNNSFDLINNSIFVATITGTLALEGAILGKRSLIFGDSWLQGCPNIIKWQDNLTYENMKNEKILNSNKILDFLLLEKQKTTIPGCQNMSAQSRYINYIKQPEFIESEHNGVVYLMKKFFLESSIKHESKL